jgi:hypothetical protein
MAGFCGHSHEPLGVLKVEDFSIGLVTISVSKKTLCGRRYWICAGNKLLLWATSAVAAGCVVIQPRFSPLGLLSRLHYFQAPSLQMLRETSGSKKQGVEKVVRWHHFALKTTLWLRENTHLVWIVVFWVVAPCSLLLTYQRFGGTCCLHLQGWNNFNYILPKRWQSEDCTAQQPRTSPQILYALSLTSNGFIYCCGVVYTRVFEEISVLGRRHAESKAFLIAWGVFTKYRAADYIT